MITELRQPLWMRTPFGEALALFLTDYGPESGHLWTCVQQDGPHTGELWTWHNSEVRVLANRSMLRGNGNASETKSGMDYRSKDQSKNMVSGQSKIIYVDTESVEVGRLRGSFTKRRGRSPEPDGGSEARRQDRKNGTGSGPQETKTQIHIRTKTGLKKRR